VSPLSLLLAEVEQNNLLPLRNTAQSGWSQEGIVFSVLGGVAAACFLIVYLFRNRILHRRDRRLSHERGSAPASSRSAATNGDSGKRRRRRSRRSRWRTNPTLAQTGGLPPPRNEDSPQPR